MSNPHKKLVLDALSGYRGDDLYRAQAAFRNCTPQQMQEQYGQSGCTRQQVLDEYQAHHARVTAAIEWIKSLP